MAKGATSFVSVARAGRPGLGRDHGGPALAIRGMGECLDRTLCAVTAPGLVTLGVPVGNFVHVVVDVGHEP
jgi:hypothetical protein